MIGLLLQNRSDSEKEIVLKLTPTCAAKALNIVADYKRAGTKSLPNHREVAALLVQGGVH